MHKTEFEIQLLGHFKSLTETGDLDILGFDTDVLNLTDQTRAKSVVKKWDEWLAKKIEGRQNAIDKYEKKLAEKNAKREPKPDAKRGRPKNQTPVEVAKPKPTLKLKKKKK